MKPWEKNKTLYEDCGGFDNYNTTAETAELILRGYLPHFMNKIICCPCDSENSEIVKWLKTNTNSKIIYFADKDFNSEEAHAIMLKCDMIVTNPPFSIKQYRPLHIWCQENNKDFFLFCGQAELKDMKLLNITYTYKPKRGNRYSFTRDDGRITYAATYVYSNIKPPYRFRHPTKDYKHGDIVPLTSVLYFDKDDTEFSLINIPGKYVRVKCEKR